MRGRSKLRETARLGLAAEHPDRKGPPRLPASLDVFRLPDIVQDIASSETGSALRKALRRWFPQSKTPAIERAIRTVVTGLVLQGGLQSARNEKGTVSEARAAISELEAALGAAVKASGKIRRNAHASDSLRTSLAQSSKRRFERDDRVLARALLEGFRGTRRARRAVEEMPQGRRQPTLVDTEAFALDMRRVWEANGQRNNRRKLLRRFSVSRNTHATPGPEEFMREMLSLGGFDVGPEAIREAIRSAASKRSVRQ